MEVWTSPLQNSAYDTLSFLLQTEILLFSTLTSKISRVLRPAALGQPTLNLGGYLKASKSAAYKRVSEWLCQFEKHSSQQNIHTYTKTGRRILSVCGRLVIDGLTGHVRTKVRVCERCHVTVFRHMTSPRELHHQILMTRIKTTKRCSSRSRPTLLHYSASEWRRHLRYAENRKISIRSKIRCNTIMQNAQKPIGR